MTRDHAIPGYAFQPGIDHDVFYPSDSGKLPDLRRMFFYGRPEVPRNGFSLGVHGLHMIQQAYSDAEVFVAGHSKAYSESGLRGQFLRVHGLPRDRAKCIAPAAV